MAFITSKDPNSPFYQGQDPYTNPESQVYNPYADPNANYGYSAPNPYTDPNSEAAQVKAGQETAADNEAARQAQEDRDYFANADAHADYTQAASGTNLGSWEYSQGMYDPSAVRKDQSAKERIAQQQQNYILGGYTGYANDASALARGAVSPAAGMLDIYGNQFFGQAAEGANIMGQGVGGLYDQAGALNAYAQQGPGASVAQAQLDANTANSMRQQLAMAGSGRGQGGGASQFRQAAANQAMIGGQANAASSMLQAQEAQDWRSAQLAAMQGAGSLYGQGAQLGGQYAGQMGDLASQAQLGSGQLGLSGEELAHQIQATALSGSQAYEGNLTDIYGIDRGIGKQPSTDMTTKDWISLGADTASSFISTL